MIARQDSPRKSIVLPGNVTIADTVTAGQLEAAYRVLNAAELLKWIFYCLLAREQLRARAVYKGFKQMINRSPKILRLTCRLGPSRGE